MAQQAFKKTGHIYAEQPNSLSQNPFIYFVGNNFFFWYCGAVELGFTNQRDHLMSL